jgi:hypothetical protein
MLRRLKNPAMIDGLTTLGLFLLMLGVLVLWA